MKTDEDRRRVAKRLDAFRRMLANVPDTPARRDVIDRIEDGLISIAAMIHKNTKDFMADKSPEWVDASASEISAKSRTVFEAIAQDIENLRSLQ